MRHILPSPQAHLLVLALLFSHSYVCERRMSICTYLCHAILCNLYDLVIYGQNIDKTREKLGRV